MIRSAKDSQWRIIACDLDGTLIGWNHKINDRDLAALRRAHEMGFHVAICTGRNSRECAGIIAALGLEDLGVFVNGAMVCRMANGSAVHSEYLPDELEAEAVEFFGSRGHAVLALADDSATRLPTYLLTSHAPPHRATVDWLLYNRMQAEAVDALPAGYRGRIVRLGVVVNVPESPALFAALLNHFGPRCTAHSIYSPHYDCQILEIFAPGVNKWTGLIHLAEQIGATPGQIITIGDDVNDFPMLENARLSFAVADAKEAVRAKAKRITASHADCGVAEVIDALFGGMLEEPVA